MSWLTKGAVVEPLGELQAAEGSSALTSEQESRVLDIIDSTVQNFTQRTKLIMGAATSLLPQITDLDQITDLEESIKKELTSNYGEFKGALAEIAEVTKAKAVMHEIESATLEDRWKEVSNIIDDLDASERKALYEKFHGPLTWDFDPDAQYLKYYLGNIRRENVTTVLRTLQQILTARKTAEFMEEVSAPKEKELEEHYPTVERIISYLGVVKKHYRSGTSEFRQKIQDKINEIFPMLEELLDKQIQFLKRLFDKKKASVLKKPLSEEEQRFVERLDPLKAT